MDTAHGRPHLDCLSPSPDAGVERKIWLDEGYTYERMKQYLLANWRCFVVRYVDDQT